MKVTPMFLGACALVSIAGAVSGASINTTVIQPGAIGSDQVRAPQIAAQTWRPEAPRPDHLDMRTPDGLIAASDLSQHGLYSQARFGMNEVREIAPAPQAVAHDYADEPAPPQPAIQAASAQPQSLDTAPLSLDGPAQIDGGPRVIDVASELAYH